MKVAEFFEYLRSLEVDLPKLDDARKDFGIIIPKTENEDFTAVGVETISLFDKKPAATTTSSNPSNKSMGGNIEEIYIKIEKNENQGIDVICAKNLQKNNLKMETDEDSDDDDDDEDYKCEDGEDDDSLYDEIEEADHPESNSLRLRNKSIVKVESKPNEKKRKAKLKSDDEMDEDYSPGPKKARQQKKLKKNVEIEDETEEPEKYDDTKPENEEEMKLLNAKNYLNYLVNMELALKAIRVNNMRAAAASRKYGIPAKTLILRLRRLGFYSNDNTTVFNDEQERKLIIRWLKKKTEQNPRNPITADDLLKHVRQSAKNYNIVLKGRKLTYPWLKLFIEKHKEQIGEEFSQKLIEECESKTPPVPIKKKIHKKLEQKAYSTDILKISYQDINEDEIIKNNQQLDFLRKVSPQWKDLELALKLVASNQCTPHSAARRFELPLLIFMKILKAYNLEIENRNDKLPTFNEEQEQVLLEWILNYPDKSKLTKHKFRVFAEEYAVKCGYLTVTSLGVKRYGANWAKHFVDNHKDKIGEDLANQMRLMVKGIDPEEDEQLRTKMIEKRNSNYYAYTPEDVEAAINLMKTTRCGFAYASKQFNISTTTLKRHLEKHDDPNKRTWTVFTMKQERHIVNWILERNQILPVTCEELRNYGTDYAHQNGIKLMGARVSTRWIAYFIRRHKLKIGHLKDQLLSNRILDNTEMFDVEPYDMDSDNQVDGDSSDNEELDIDENEIPIVTK